MVVRFEDLGSLIAQTNLVDVDFSVNWYGSVVRKAASRACYAQFSDAFRFVPLSFYRSCLIGAGMAALENKGPMWSQDQAIAFEAALEAVNDVIAGYSEQIDAEESRPEPNPARVAWLNMRIDQATDVMRSLNVTDTADVQRVLAEYSAIVRARDAMQTICPRNLRMF